MISHFLWLFLLLHFDFLLLSLYFYLLSFIMDCRENCGACCIALSISTPITGMPDGKPAGVKCIHLLDDLRCAIYNSNDKPKVCSDFKAETEFCGTDREEAMRILYSLSNCPPTHWFFFAPPAYRQAGIHPKGGLILYIIEIQINTTELAPL